MKKLFPFLFIAAAIIFLSSRYTVSVAANEGDPGFSEITVTSSSSHLLFFAQLKNSFTEEMIEGLHSGLPVKFTFFVELAPTEEGWNSERSITLITNHIVTYDTLKDTYTVEIEESGKRFHTLDNLEDARQTANEINGLRIVELSELRPDTSYSIRVRADLYKKTLPMGLHTLIPFISWWDITTDWYSITFTN
jgi:hypothetical protein